MLSSINSKIKNKGRPYWQAREWYVRAMVAFKKLADRPKHIKPRVLFYDVAGLGYGGTESFLQILAKYINKKEYDAYFMYSDAPITGLGIEDFSSRLNFILEGGVFPIRFEYSHRDASLPFFVHNMSPNVFKIVKDFQIDLMVTTGSGHADFPFSSIHHIPIILLNVFGQPNLQANIKYHLCISEEVAGKLRPIVPEEKIKVMPVPSERPPKEAEAQGLKLRYSLGLADSDLVFGRVGRNSDNIFDPIGIRAFQSLVGKYPHMHYLVMSPAKALMEIVKRDNIPNVHYLPGSGKIEDLWAFYYAIDVLAHFRKDGESFGLNISQAMLCGRPIISHRSAFWNAHLEYLEGSDFAFVADTGNAEQYASFMEVFAKDKTEVRLMGDKARLKADKDFTIFSHIGKFEEYVKKSLAKNSNAKE